MTINKPNLIEASLLRTSVLNETKLVDALNQLVNRYDILRLRYQRHDGKVLQRYIENPKESFVCNLFNLSTNLDVYEKSQLISGWCTDLTQQLNPETGPVIAIGLIKGESAESDLLFFSIHRLFADRVAWRVLVSELYALYSGIEIFAVADTYKDWMHAMRSYAQSPLVIESHLPFWNRTMTMLSKHSIAHEKNDNRKLTRMIFDSKEFLFHLNELSLKYSIKRKDLFLSAIIFALNKLYRTNKIGLTLTGHGREFVYKEVNAGRTIGYCQIEYPAVFNVSEEDSATQMLKSITQQKSALPANGLSYYALANFHPDAGIRSQLRSKNMPEFCFDYKGNIDQLDSKSNWRIDELYIKSESGLSRRQHAVDITLFCYEGKLFFEWSCLESFLNESEVVSLFYYIRHFFDNLFTEFFNIDQFPVKTSRIEKTYRYDYDPFIVLENEPSSQAPYIFLHPGDGGAESYLNSLSLFMPFKQKMILFNNYVFQSGDLYNLPQSFEELADLYIQFLNKADLSNGVKLVGYSFGAVLAFEMAIQLEKKGIKVLELNLIDPILVSLEMESLKLPRSFHLYLASYQSKKKPKLNVKINFFKAAVNHYGSAPSEIEKQLIIASMLPFNGLYLDENQEVSTTLINCSHYELILPEYFKKIMEEIL